MALKKKTKTVLIVAAVIAAALLVWLLFLVPELIWPVLISLLVLCVGFVLIEVIRRQRKLRRQKDLDEKIAAKEGIEDRRREWAGWLAELERQGIDRYELPFYLLLGEPQSGKSILLKNSDLYFPFGQERLSGVGGTRGCDWWFTDEAVVLDIAGRLFTHEGGVADRLEWEAFLELLHEFRPLSPANGVILVIPCDSLMGDSLELCSEKANRLQTGLLSLTQSLQAQLPVYLVLTKGDQVFGFTESVHRLEAEHRHEMFGWSREANKAEAPFDLEEVRQGFHGMVDRARLLRDRMMVTARIPEALPEVDRLYGFPEELEGIWSTLEVYLKRVFSESTLVDRASFRGLYLSSGLQTGVPIAKVCADLMAGDRQADSRGLESLFSHQRAYFIKDLVRGRVFSERGLVRPTEGRVTEARRKATFGYGASAAIALAAGVFSVLTFVKPRDPLVQAHLDAAQAAARVAKDEHESVRKLLEQLATIEAAIDAPREGVYEVYESTRPDFENLYAAVFDRRLIPAMRARLEQVLSEESRKALGNGKQAVDLAADAEVLFADAIDFEEKSVREVFLRRIPEFDQVAEYVRPVLGEGRAPDPESYELEDAFERRMDLEEPVPQLAFAPSETLEALRRDLQALLDRIVTPGNKLQVGGHLGYVLAWRGVDKSLKALDGTELENDRQVLERCETFVRSLARMESIADAGELRRGEQGFELVNGALTGNSLTVEKGTLYDLFFNVIVQNSPMPPEGWPALDTLESFEAEIFRGFESESLPFNPSSLIPFRGEGRGFVLDKVNKSKGRGLTSRPVPDREIQTLLGDATLRAVCAAGPTPAWTLANVVAELEAGRVRFLEKLSATTLPHKIYRAKCLELARELTEDLTDWKAVALRLQREAQEPENPPQTGELDTRVLATLTGLRDQFLEVDPIAHAQVCRHLEKLAVEHLREVDVAWAARNASDWGPIVDWDVARALASATATPTGSDPELSDVSRRLLWAYIGAHESRYVDEWDADEDERHERTLEIAQALNEHLAQLSQVEASAGGNLTPSSDHEDWLRSVDDLFAARLEQHVSNLRSHWTPRTEQWPSLGLPVVAQEAVNALEKRTIEELLDDLALVDAPKDTEPQLAEGQRLSKHDGLPKTRAALDAWHALARPRNVASVERVGRLLVAQANDILGSPGLAQDSVRLAEKARAALLTPAPPAGDAGNAYVGLLQNAFRDRLVAEARKLYVGSFREKVLRGHSTMVSALYARSSEEINAIEDQTLLSSLATVLDAGGLLDDLREQHGMSPAEETSLRPRLDETAGDLRPLWEFETFLGGLQDFLLGDEGRAIAETTLLIRLEIPTRTAGSLWDKGQPGYLQFLHYGLDALDSSERGFFAIGSVEALKPIQWPFHQTEEEVFALRWSDRADGQPDPGDARLELFGSFAPLLLMWSGVKEDEGSAAGWYTVQVEPENTTLRAPLKLRVADRDLPERKPLERPGR